jgi:hemoglobin
MPVPEVGAKRQSARSIKAMSEEQRATAYEVLGGEPVLTRLVERFYHYMDTLPEASGIRAMHQPDLSGARGKLFKFLSGWLGGPNLYWEEFGHPRLRMRHFPFSIGGSERDQWMLCMDRAIEDCIEHPVMRERLSQALRQTADHMINQEG